MNIFKFLLSMILILFSLKENNVICQVIAVDEYINKLNLIPITIPANIPTEEMKPIKWIESTPDSTYFNFRYSFIKYNPAKKQLYIADTMNHRIVILDEKLNYITEFGKFGQGPGEIIEPHGVNFISNGNIIVSSISPVKVQIFNNNFNFINELRIKDIYLSGFYIVVDEEDNLYINNSYQTNKLFRKIDCNGNTKALFGDLFVKFINNELKQSSYNNVVFDIDKNDNLYCVSKEFLIFRKYDRNNQLIFERSLISLPSIQHLMKIYKENIENRKIEKNTGNYHFLFVNDIAVYENFIYLLTNYMSEIYVIDIKDNQIKKTIKLYSPSITKHDINNLEINNVIYKIDFSSIKYNYAITNKMYVVIYNK